VLTKSAFLVKEVGAKGNYAVNLTKELHMFAQIVKTALRGCGF